MQKRLSLAEIDKLHGFDPGTSNSIFNFVSDYLEQGQDYVKKGQVRQGDGIYVDVNGYLMIYARMPHTEETQNSMREVLQQFCGDTNELGSLEQCIALLKNPSNVEQPYASLHLKEKDSIKGEAMKFAETMAHTAIEISNNDPGVGFYFLNRATIAFIKKKGTPYTNKRMSKDKLYRYIATYFYDCSKEFEDFLYEFADNAEKQSE